MGILDKLKKYRSTSTQAVRNDITTDERVDIKKRYYPSESKKLYFLIRDVSDQLIKTRVLNLSMDSISIDMHGYPDESLIIDASIEGYIVEKIDHQALNKIPCRLLVRRAQRINQFSCVVGYDFEEVDPRKISALLKRLEVGKHVET